MKAIKAFYSGFCKVEETIVAVFVAVITFLIFVSAIARGLNHPLNWAPDTSLLLLAWVIFLGADSALRRSDFIRVDMLLKYFPQKLQEFLYYFFYVVTIIFLGILTRYGIPLCFENSKRNFQALTISYSWATISVPVGAILMTITIVLKLIKRWKQEKIKPEGSEAI
jgi:TRAP-type C4-dicarboxylate transport system permease small subunit